MAGKRNQSKSKKKKGKVARKRRVKTHVCKALILIDEKPIRRKAVNKCKYILKKFETVVDDLDRFDHIDNPEFQQWLHAKFGKQLSSLREMKEKSFLLEDLLSHIEYLHWYEGLSFFEAHRKALDMRENPEKYESEDDFPEDENPDAEEVPDENFFREFSEILDEIFDFDDFDDFNDFDDFFSSFKKHHKSDHIRDNPQDDPREMLFKEKPKDNRLKSIYRSLAGKLHPDKRAPEDTKLDNLWFRVQEAYAQKNLEDLQTLQAGYEIHNTKGFIGLSISSILAVHEHYKEQLRLLRRRHRQLKTSEAWGFSSQNDSQREKLHHHVETGLSFDIDNTQKNIIQLETRLKRYSEPPETKTERKKPKYVSDKQLSLF